MTQRVIEEILSQEEICPNHFKMKVKASQIAKEAKPGQFVHIKWVSQLNGTDPLLRRPISINAVNIDEGSITIIYRVVGRGTKLLSQLGIGDKLDIMGPIGSGFSIPQAKNKFLVVGGGIGIAPLFPIVKELITRDKEVVVLLGAETKDQLLNLTEYQDLDLQLKVVTVDGSAGQQGFVTDLLGDLVDVDYVYTCGPLSMMAVIQNWVKKIGIKGEASLEERMGCGTGACLSCVCKVKIKGQEGWKYEKTCTTGPIFPLTEVVFDE